MQISKEQFEAEVKKQVEQYKKAVLDVLFLGPLLLDKMEMLRGSKKYNKEVKSYGNLFIKSLERHIEKDVDELYRMSPESYHNISNSVEKLADFHVDDFVLLSKLMEAYIEDPKKFRENFQFYFDELNQ